MRARTGRWFAPVVLVVLAVLIGSGCYHAVIETGRPQSGTTIERAWAHGFLYGLVPPDPVETASQCPNGVARVETMHSFLNSLAAGITFGLYTPITIEVHCAATGQDADAPALTYLRGDGPDARLATALVSGEPFYIRVEPAR